jgi:hypothetical protein
LVRALRCEAAITAFGDHPNDIIRVACESRHEHLCAHALATWEQGRLLAAADEVIE